MRNICCANDTVKEMKNQTTELKIYFQITNQKRKKKNLYPEYFKRNLKLNKKINNPIIIREMQIKNTMRYHHKHTRLAHINTHTKSNS